nr:hypothetical protein CFP56_47111 [Quercus suber]
MPRGRTRPDAARHGPTRHGFAISGIPAASPRPAKSDSGATPLEPRRCFTDIPSVVTPLFLIFSIVGRVLTHAFYVKILIFGGILSCQIFFHEGVLGSSWEHSPPSGEFITVRAIL